MKLLLVGINAKYIHSNVAIRLLKAYAEAHLDLMDTEITIAEFSINNRAEEILAGLYQHKPDVILFSCYIWNWNLVERLCVELPKILPGIDIWLGGPEVSFDADVILTGHPEVCGVMLGEGEAVFTALVKDYMEAEQAPPRISSPENRKALPGLCLQASPPFFTEPCPPLDLDEIPFLYTEENLADFEHKILYYESSRGCPFSCSYCLSSVDQQVRFLSEERTAADLQFFLDHKIPQVKFVDRTFNCNHRHSEFVLEYILEHDNGITNFHFEVAGDILSERELELLSEMRPGLVQLEIGVQSTNRQTIKEIHRTMDLERLKRNVARIHKGRNVHQHLDLIAGLPFEDLTSFEKSFNEVYAMAPDQLQLGFLKVLKGSYMASKTQEYALLFTEQVPYEVLCTAWLSYDDVLRLKQIEAMVELFYNSNQFVNTLKVLVRVFPSAFAMFDALAAFFREGGFFINQPARVYRYQLLLAFALVYDNANEALYKELLTYDMYLRENCKSRPVFANDLKPYQTQLRQYGKTHLTHADVFCFSVWEDNPALLAQPAIVRFDYGQTDPLSHNATVKREKVAK